MKTSSDFDQRSNRSAHDDSPAGRINDTRKEFEDRAFAGAVRADQPESFSLIDFKTDIVQRIKFLLLARPPALYQSGDLFANRSGPELAQAITLRNLIDGDD